MDHMQLMHAWLSEELCSITFMESVIFNSEYTRYHLSAGLCSDLLWEGLQRSLAGSGKGTPSWGGYTKRKGRKR